MKKRVLGILLAVTLLFSMMPIAAIPTAAADLPALQNVTLRADGVLTFDPFVNPQGGNVVYDFSINKLKAPVSGGGQTESNVIDIRKYIDDRDWGEATYTVSVYAQNGYRYEGGRAISQTWSGTYLYYSNPNQPLGIWVNGQQFTMQNAASGIACGGGRAYLNTATNPFTLTLNNATINEVYIYDYLSTKEYCGIFGDPDVAGNTSNININVVGNNTINLTDKTATGSINCGVDFNGTVNVFGTGSLTVNAGNAEKNAKGIDATHLNIKDITLKINSAKGGLGSNFSASTLSFENADVTVIAPDGIISDGTVTCVGYQSAQVLLSDNVTGTGAAPWNGSSAAFKNAKYLRIKNGIPFEIFGTPYVGNTIIAGASCSDDIMMDYFDGLLAPYQGSQYGRWIYIPANSTQEIVLQPTTDDEYDIELTIQSSWVGGTIYAEFQRADGKKYVSTPVTVIPNVASAIGRNGLRYTVIDTNHGFTAKLTGPSTLSGDIVIPEKITPSGVDIPVTAIAESVFLGNTGITGVSMPDTITDVSMVAFVGCTNLKTVHLSNALKITRDGMFVGCSSLETVNIPTATTEIPSDFFIGLTNLKNVTIPDTVTSIGSQAFSNCRAIESLKLPSKLTSIGDKAFYQCLNWGDFGGTSILTLPSTLTTIGASAFERCGSIKYVEIPNGVTQIPAGAFRYAVNLRTVTLPKTVKTVGENAFNNTPYFNSVTFVDGTMAEWNTLISDANCAAGNENLKNATVTYTITHRVTFDMRYYGTQNPVLSQTVMEGGKVIRPEDPTSDDMVFGGWYKDINITKPYDFDTPVTKDITLYAKWTEGIEITEVDLTFDFDTFNPYFKVGESGATADDLIVRKGLIGGSNEKYYVVYNNAWPIHYSDARGVMFRANSTNFGLDNEGYFIVFKVKARTGYDLPHFSSDIKTVTLNGEPITPAKMGYSQMSTGETVLDIYLPIGTPSYDGHLVRFETNGHAGLQKPVTQVVPVGGTATKPADLVSGGYVFGGWFTNADGTGAFDFNSEITADITLYAKWYSSSEITATRLVDLKAAILHNTATAEDDFNGDGTVDVRDVVQLKKLLAQLG